jgi:hypothetical protein
VVDLVVQAYQEQQEHLEVEELVRRNNQAQP